MHTRISSFLGYQSQKITLSKFKRTFNCDHLQSGEPSPSIHRLYSIVLTTFLFSEFIPRMPKSSSLNMLCSRHNSPQRYETQGHWGTTARCLRTEVTRPDPRSSRRGITPGTALTSGPAAPEAPRPGSSMAQHWADCCSAAGRAWGEEAALRAGEVMRQGLLSRSHPSAPPLPGHLRRYLGVCGGGLLLGRRWHRRARVWHDGRGSC